MKKQEKRTDVCMDVEWYKEKILEMVRRIDDSVILRKIYIIVQTYLSET